MFAMYSKLSLLALFLVWQSASASLWAGVAVISPLPSLSTGTANRLYATDASGNPVEGLPTDGRDLTTVSDADVTGVPPGGTGAHYFTFGPELNLESSEPATGSILYFDDAPHTPLQSVGNAGAHSGGEKPNSPMTAQFSPGGGGGGMLLTHGLPGGTSSNFWGGQSLMQGGNQPSHLAGGGNTGGVNFLQNASSHWALDQFSNALVTGSPVDSERLSSFAATNGETNDFFISGTWGVGHHFGDSLTSTLTEQTSFNVTGMAPEPGSLMVWGLIGLIFGGAGWRHRRRLLALA